MTPLSGQSVVFAPQPRPLVDAAMLSRLKSAAEIAPLGRARLCLHRDHDDPVQEMIIVHTRRSWDRPHRHRRKSISIMLLEGRLRLPLFADDGQVITCLELGTMTSALPFMTRFSEGEWYACVPVTEPVVIYEALTGPFRKGEDFYPDWAPEEGPELAALLRRAAGL
ncbi:MAG: cupin fold metalloprotein, WbuC family [Magnetococcales bacterium]|nr:cupin fold metalloprotein, WbuC family [Magnetococcales bacterium]